MPTTADFPSAHDSRWFRITGPVADWDAVGRRLRIGDRDLWLAPDVSESGLARRVTVSASGQADETTGRWIAQRLTLA